MVNKPLLGISVMPEPIFLQAVFPLLQNGDIEAIEWSFDTIELEADKPKWLHHLLDEYSEQNRLIGHGVFYSIFNAKWNSDQEKWLKQLKEEVVKYNYQHISEHFGFMSNGIDHHKGCPFPVPLNKITLAIGVDRLKRLQEVAQLPVGIENLAFSFSKIDVMQQGEFIANLIEPINGFMILDLHNIYCQAENFEIEMMDLIDCYPLNSVKEIHISGGSWQKSTYKNTKKTIRRDTHDGRIPKIIFDILPAVLRKCKHIEFVVFEQTSNSFRNEIDLVNYRKDFIKLKKCIENNAFEIEKKLWGNKILAGPKPIEDDILLAEQNLLCNTLLQVGNAEELLSKINLKNWGMDKWNLEMINTSISLIKKWN